MNRIKKTFLNALLLLTMGTPAFAGQLILGGQFDAWNATNTVNPDGSPAPHNFEGWELWAPLSLSFNVGGGLGFYGQTEYGNGAYTDTTNGITNTQYLNHLSDSLAGAELNFKSFNVPSVFNIGFNIPTGDPSWEQKQIASSVPTQFIASRYRGRGFGVSAMYALAFQAGGAQIGAAVGYLFSGGYNPNFGTSSPVADLNLGDSIFLSFNHVQPFSDNQSQVIRLSGLLSTNTQIDGQNVFQMGPNLNASYSWKNPMAFSFDLGVQYFLPGQRQINGGPFAAESQGSYGTRFYLTPSYVLGDFILAAQAKYILPNGYAQNDPSNLYNGGGYLLGVEPSYRLNLDEVSALKFTAGFDFINAQNLGLTLGGSGRADIFYNNWTFGTSYEIKL